LWHIYPFYILVDRAGAATVTLLTKEIPLRLLVEKKADVMMDSEGCQNQNFNNPVMCHGACQIERNATVVHTRWHGGGQGIPVADGL